MLSGRGRRGGRRAGLIAAVAVLLVAGFPAATAHAAEPCDGVDRSANGAKGRYPVMQTDKMEIVFLDGCALERKWENSYKGSDFSLWQPASWVWDAFPASDGWRSPGDLPVSVAGSSDWKLDPPENYATFVVRDRSTGTVGLPVSYQKLWVDHDTGGHPDIALFEPVCAPGFDALGLVSKPHSRDSPDPDTVTAGWLGNGAVGCFSRNVTYPMEPAKVDGSPDGTVWNSRDLSGSADIGLYAVQRPAGPVSAKNTIVVPSPTIWAEKDSYDAPDLEKFRGLELPIAPPSTRGPDLQPPVLTGNNADDREHHVVPGFFTVSGMQAQDSKFYPSEIAKLRESPIYRVDTSTEWKPLDGGLLCGADGPDCVTSHAAGTSHSETTTWNNTVGGEISFSASTEVKASAGVVGTGYTLTFGLAISYSHEFGGSEEWAKNRTTTLQNTLRPGEYGVYFQAETTYTEYRKNTSDAANKVREYKAQDGPIVFARYPASPPKMPNTFPVTALDDLVRNTQVFSESGEYYLMLTTSGALEVRNSDEGVGQPTRGAWYLDRFHPHGRIGFPIDKVSFLDGRLRVESQHTEPWCSTPQTHPGAKLEIAKDGNLRVVDGTDPRVTYWNAKYDSSASAGVC